jgi:hypothetical protein
LEVASEEVGLCDVICPLEVLFDSRGAFGADLRKSAFEVFAILRVLDFVLVVLRMRVGGQVFGEQIGDHLLVLETSFAKEVGRLGLDGRCRSLDRVRKGSGLFGTWCSRRIGNVSILW